MFMDSEFQSWEVDIHKDRTFGIEFAFKNQTLLPVLTIETALFAY